jgi:hypothetical protein
MRTFAQKPKATQQTTSAKPAIPSRVHCGQSREVSSILNLQRTIGNQAVQQLLQAKTEDFKASPVSGTSPSLTYDFSRIPVHTSLGGNRTLSALEQAGQPLSSVDQDYFLSQLGMDVSQVRIHTSQQDEVIAQQYGAQALTYGKHIVFNHGQYQPQTTAGKELLAHELTHVKQQSTAEPTPKKVQRKSLADRKLEETHRETQRRVRTLIKGTVWSRARGQEEGSPIFFEEHMVWDPVRIRANTKAWINAGLAQLTILSPVPGKATESRETFFDPTVDFPNLGGSINNTKTFEKDLRAQTDGRHIYLMVRPGQTDEAIAQTLMHEVQHIADVHTRESDKMKQLLQEAQSLKTKESIRAVMHQSIWENYQSEFRSYWIESLALPPYGSTPRYDGRFGSPYGPGGKITIKSRPSVANDPACMGEVTLNLQNEKQTNIARHIISKYGNMEEGLLCSEALREQVEQFTSPAGINFINSVRIERLQQVIYNPPAQSIWPVAPNKKQDVINAAKRLNRMDMLYLRTSEAKPFWELAQQKLDHELYQWLYNYITTDQTTS